MSPRPVSSEDVTRTLRELGVAGRDVCMHTSLGSFGPLDDGPRTVIEGVLAADCTLLVPTHSFRTYAIPPPEGMRPARNGWDYDEQPPQPVDAPVFRPDSNEVDHEMGALPRAVLATPGRVRGDHPLASFTALGPHAHALVSSQHPGDSCAPLARLARREGFVVLAGVGLTRMTLLHLAERRAGRNLFRRWAKGPDGEPAMVEVGGCSAGFESFAKHLHQLERQARVGESIWRVFPAKSALNVAAHAIRRDPRVTHCGDDRCLRCNDAVRGGPEIERESTR